MKFKLNIFFLKNLIESDFSIINSNNNISNNHINSILKINKKNSIFSLELFQLIKDLKQFIRILQFLKSKKKKHIYVYIDKLQLELFQKTIDELFLNKNFTIKSDSFYKEDFYKNLKSTRLLLMLKNLLSRNLLNKFLDNNVFLINNINSNLEKKSISTYKIYNKLNDFKKIIFLVILMNKIFKK